MAVILADATATTLDLTALPNELKKQGLPSYARPCFVRLTAHIDMTGELRRLSFSARHSLLTVPGTFKVKKTLFQDEGYDLHRVTEPIFYLNQQKQVYERLTPSIYEAILQNKIKF